jgi:hypothetical protein
MITTSAVLLESSELPPPDVLAEAFERCAAFPPPVAVRLAHRAKWFLWENAPSAPAQVLGQGLTAAGYATRVVPQSAVVAAAPPRRVHVLKLDGDALGVQLKYTGPPTWILWQDVLVLSAGAIRTETTRRETTEVLLLSGERMVDTRTLTDIERAVLADIYVLSAGELLYLRLNCHEVNYAQTTGGSVKEGWREKFSLLLARLGLRATSAVISPQTEALLAAGMIPDAALPSPYFTSEDEFAQYNRWLVTRKRLGL